MGYILRSHCVGIKDGREGTIEHTCPSLLYSVPLQGPGLILAVVD